MVDKNKIDTNYVQQGNTCVLASYGIAANYFSRISIPNYFTDYCTHFNVSIRDLEKHFRDYISSKQISGYDLIEILYTNSGQNSFLTDRKTFFIKKYSHTLAEVNRIEKNLISNNALILITYETSGNFHSVVVGYDREFQLRDPLKKNINQIPDITSLGYSHGTLRDALLIYEKCDICK